jgi:Bacterial dnaA  protein/DnaA N-terminal domain
MTTAINAAAVREREMANPWDRFLERVKSRVSINTYTTWFQPTRLNRADGEMLHVQIPNPVFRQVLTRTYGEIVKAVFHELGTPNMRVQYLCSEDEPAAPSAAVPIKQSKLDFESSDHQLNARYTFDSFVVGKSNEFAHAASRAVAEQPSKAYNPLFLYGGVGMGKTHLMHAIGHTIKKRNPAMRLSYVSAEKFTIEVINSLRFDRMISFRDRFHTVDVLLVERRIPFFVVFCPPVREFPPNSKISPTKHNPAITCGESPVGVGRAEHAVAEHAALLDPVDVEAPVRLRKSPCHLVSQNRHFSKTSHPPIRNLGQRKPQGRTQRRTCQLFRG